MKHIEPPLQHIFDLSDLSQAGAEVVVEASPEDLPKLAKWAGIDSVKRFTATVGLRRLSQTRFNYEANLTADVVQSCVVTLEPVESRISREIARELQQAPRLPQETVAELTLAAGDDDVPETILSLDYDLAAPLLEEFVLAIDPYPRKPGVAFTPPVEPETPQSSPFAVLKALKDRD
ncbi:YceD family protein [Rhizomicrobium electricum]|uniref:DUF177 domain-containing protein n=1 Tax=Rhizomicrobium electricum TaxID=480070 RepID=A0ABP3PQI2_9PROT|nr:DUF177 domain-containing protein [Rhizomicrobium electricum]NIJ48779.1 uncharacterized metal-binding protein YceD (DUF177 family) [Rhizomicrobium electricum]